MLPARTCDPALPALDAALDTDVAARALGQSPAFAGCRVGVTSARLTRHKPGRRCLIEYDLDVTWSEGPREVFTVIGKMRSGHRSTSAAKRLDAFWRAGFSATSADGVSVPECLGSVPPLGLWLQRKVVGVSATTLLATSDGPALAARIGAATRKVRGAGVPTRRTHSVDRELEILARVVAQVADRPGWRRRVGALLARCAQAARQVTTRSGAIHRDFYADQIIVQGPRLYLLDFDLYCQGPAGVDVGNFIGHLLEQAVREPDCAGHLTAVERALEEDVRRHDGEAALSDVRIFTLLTLARHVYLSTVLPGREPSSDLMLDAALARAEGFHVAA